MSEEDNYLFKKFSEEENKTQEEFMHILLQSYFNSTLVKVEKEKSSLIINENNVLRQAIAERDNEIRIMYKKIYDLLAVVL